jgi:hypothetical protein
MEPEPLASEAPAEITGDGGGVSLKIRWKLIATVIGLLAGGGTIAGLSTRVGMTDGAAAEVEAFKGEQAAAHLTISESLEKQVAHAAVQDARIQDVTEVVRSVQVTQQRDVSRTEARRLTETIGNRKERERTYDRLYELNLKRLGRGADPCGTVSCD